MNLLYDLEYWVGNKKVETVFYQKTRAICMWKIKQLKDTHKLGKFKIK